MSTGASGSCRRDSLITSLSRYSGSAKSCSRRNVVLFILEKKKEINNSQQEQLSPVAAGGQRWVKKLKELYNKSSLILILEGNEIFCGNLYFCLCFSRVFVLQISVSREINMTEVVSNE